MTKTVRTLASLGLLLALCLTFASPAAADNRLVDNTFASLFSSQSIAASALVTAVIDLEKACVQGVGWSFTTTGSINVAALVQYSDRAISATSTQWETAASIHSSTLTGSWTISADKRRTNLLLAPARFVKFQLTNSDTVPVTLNWFTLFKQ